MYTFRAQMRYAETLPGETPLSQSHDMMNIFVAGPKPPAQECPRATFQSISARKEVNVPKVVSTPRLLNISPIWDSISCRRWFCLANCRRLGDVSAHGARNRTPERRPPSPACQVALDASSQWNSIRSRPQLAFVSEGFPNVEIIAADISPSISILCLPQSRSAASRTNSSDSGHK